MIQRRNIAPWGIPRILRYIPIYATVLLAACVATPAFAGGTNDGLTRGVGPIAHEPEIPNCYPSIAAAAAQLLETYDETPLVGIYRGGTEERPQYLISIFVNPETGTWTLTQSDNVKTCIGTGVTHGFGGILFDMDRLIEDSRVRNLGTES